MDRRTFLAGSSKLLIAGTVPCSVGCGTIFHSERIGQPHSHEIDWKIVALDGLGLLCFFVPGVVAFAVDFCTGAIYLPYGSVSGYPDYPPPEQAPLADPQYGPPHEPIPTVPYFPNASAPAVRPPQPDVESGQALYQVNVPRDVLNQQGIQRAVSEHIGKPITLDDAAARVSPLDRLDGFAQACRQHLANPRFGWPVREFFRDRSRA